MSTQPRQVVHEIPPDIRGVVHIRRRKHVQQRSQFELVAEQIGVAEKFYEFSEPLRLWVRKHKNTHYVPEWLLEKWGMEVLCNMPD